MGIFGLSRDKVMQLLDEHVITDHLRKHSLATEAVMRGLAARLNEDAETWGLVGLVHDLDFDETKDDMSKHTIVAAEILRSHNVPEEYVSAIISHCEHTPGWQPRTKPLEHALAASEAITGLVVATSLVMPDKKVASVKPKSVRKRMGETAFARNVDRNAILECEKLGVPIEEFCEIAVRAMQGIAEQLGL
ncbi:MAG TPA: HDIG domain-containing protein [Candidatus Sumerlaeota bacterium]|nr:MAG: HD domain protein [candidate division BRC1 bacterium ADurb.Bin183]HOE64589.1 HDIG domain-containing protein [Candidatus Sumerlaeota bacterium]HRR30376.1 HDIG domain-containing protein [Candidatus Sumerlaeia bacterium]HON51126.1 HDIG domain-containing protein [Candidatus Sumerlaeota bacterium]HOR64995.1 HDIG domain-containing protein [Candidatus Sumerlaeota bacterium]